MRAGFTVKCVTYSGWDALSYDVYALPHDRWGRETVLRLNLAGDETALDFGCGTGRDVARLIDLLPHGRVVAVDGSAEMLSRLRERLAGRLDSVDVVQTDLREPLPGITVDAVLSVATLHWLPDHAATFAHIAAVLRSGGRLAAEAGGRGNLSNLLRALEHVGGPRSDTRHFAGVDETVRHLRAAGFIDVEVDLVADPMELEPDLLERFLATILLVPELAALPVTEHNAFVRAVAKSMTDPVIDWVRLRLAAVRR
jgi:trans-aconitate 2-methyltransferase